MAVPKPRAAFCLKHIRRNECTTQSFPTRKSGLKRGC